MTDVGTSALAGRSAASGLSFGGGMSSSGMPTMPPPQQQQQQPIDPTAMLSALSTWTTPLTSLPLRTPLPDHSTAAGKDGQAAATSTAAAPWAALVVLMPGDNAATTPRTRQLLDRVVEPVSNRILEVLAASQAGRDPAQSENGSSRDAKGKGKAAASPPSAAQDEPVLEIGAVVYGSKRTRERPAGNGADSWLDELQEGNSSSRHAALRKIPLMPSAQFFHSMRDERTLHLAPPSAAARVLRDVQPHAVDLDSLLYGLDHDGDSAMASSQGAALEESWWRAGTEERKEARAREDGLLLADALVAALEMLPDGRANSSHPFVRPRPPPISLYVLNFIPSTCSRPGEVPLSLPLRISSLPALRNDISFYDEWSWEKAAAQFVARGVFVSSVLCEPTNLMDEAAAADSQSASPTKEGLPAGSLCAQVHALLVGLEKDAVVPHDTASQIYTNTDDKAGPVTPPQSLTFAFSGFSAATSHLGSGSMKCRRQSKANQRLLAAAGQGADGRRKSLAVAEQMQQNIQQHLHQQQQQNSAQSGLSGPAAAGLSGSAQANGSAQRAPTQHNGAPDYRVIHAALVRAKENKVPGVDDQAISTVGFLISQLIVMSKGLAGVYQVKKLIESGQQLPNPAPVNADQVRNITMADLNEIRTQLMAVQQSFFQYVALLAKGANPQNNVVAFAQKLVTIDQLGKNKGLRLGGPTTSKESQMAFQRFAQQHAALRQGLAPGATAAPGNAAPAQPQPPAMSSMTIPTTAPVAAQPAALPPPAQPAPPAQNAPATQSTEATPRQVLWSGCIAWRTSPDKGPPQQVEAKSLAIAVQQRSLQEYLVPFPNVLNIDSVIKADMQAIRIFTQRQNLPCVVFSPVPNSSGAPEDAAKAQQNQILFYQFAKALETKSSVAHVRHQRGGILLIASSTPTQSGARSVPRMLGLISKEPIPLSSFAAQPGAPVQATAPAAALSAAPQQQAQQQQQQQQQPAQPWMQNQAPSAAPAWQNQAQPAQAVPQANAAQAQMAQLMQQVAKATGVQNLSSMNPQMWASLDPTLRARLGQLMQAAATAKQAQPAAQQPVAAQAMAPQFNLNNNFTLQQPPQMQQAMQVQQQQPQPNAAPQFTMPFGNPTPQQILQQQMPAQGMAGLNAGGMGGIDMNLLAQMLQQQQQQQKQ